MIKKEHLFALIKSLTKAEKRYFKLFASVNNADVNYLILFDAIDKQDVYDEKSIKKQFSGQKFVKQLHVTKNYLNKLILKSLRNFHSRISKEAELKDILREVEILYRKELFDQCFYVIERAEKLAEGFELGIGLMDVLQWKRKLLLATGGSFQKQNELNKVLLKEKEAANNLVLLNQYWDHSINIVDYFRDGGKKISQLLRKPLIKNVEFAKTLQSKILLYHIRYTINIIKNNIEQALETLSEMIEYIESYPERIKDDPHSYITSLNNKIGMLLTIKEYEEIPELLEKIRGVPETYDLKDKGLITVKLLLRTYNVELEIYRDTGDFDKGVQLADKVKELLQNCSDNVSSTYKGLLLYQSAYIYFMKDNYSESLKCINELLSSGHEKTREDMESYARFLNLIIHYELKNIYVLRYAVEACRRFLKKKRKLHDFEKKLLKFFSRLSTTHPEKHLQLFKKLRTELFANTGKSERESVLDYLDFENWIDGKVGNF